ncbi:hypothetical protein QUF76_07500 [Desulfobacterales bacterium HSG16]|nr:hypothetical protein [Desulfobacterales bacterium HSG16]
MSIISNTTVISNFAAIGQMTLLYRIYGKIHISGEVYEEIRKGLEEGYLFYADIEKHIFPFSDSGWIHLINMAGENEFRMFGRFPSKLGKGESSCLSIASPRNWLFLTDDLDARKQAKLMNIRISGSLGCLILAIEKNICTLEQGNIWLNQMIEEGYRSPVYDLEQLLR